MSKWIAGLSPARMAAYGLSLLVVLISVIWIGSAWLSVNNGVVDKQNNLSSQYSTNQAQLGECLQSSVDQLKIANLSVDKVLGAMVAAVKGRYDSPGSTAQPRGGEFFSAIQEAYPNLDKSQGLYEKILGYVQDCRSEFTNLQTKLQAQLNNFSTFIQKWPNSMFAGGYPDDRLYARIGGTTFTGAKALEKMKQVVTTDAARGAFESGTLPGIDVPGVAE